MQHLNLSEQAEEAPNGAGGEAGQPRHVLDVAEWMLDTLAQMSAAETVAFSGIIAAAIALCWRAAR
jgi:hypothetical protein